MRACVRELCQLRDYAIASTRKGLENMKWTPLAQGALWRPEAAKKLRKWCKLGALPAFPCQCLNSYLIYRMVDQVQSFCLFLLFRLLTLFMLIYCCQYQPPILWELSLIYYNSWMPLFPFCRPQRPWGSSFPMFHVICEWELFSACCAALIWRLCTVHT